MGGIIDNFIGTVKNGLAFRGRTDRRDYWVFILTFLVILAVLLWFAEKISSSAATGANIVILAGK